MDDLIEREPIEDYLRRKAKWVEPEFDIVEQHRLLEAADRIAALEAENARLIGDLADTKAEYHRVSEVSLELAKDKARLCEALEQFLSLIEYQYCGSREAMNALQEADNSARAALEPMSKENAETFARSGNV